MAISSDIRSRLRRQLLLVVLSCACALPAMARSPMVFQHLGIDEGLSQNTVMDTFQDSRGFMWIATEAGLNRFDGNDLIVYSREPGDADAIASDYVWAIDEDADGNLWLATDGGGVAVWQRQEDRFIAIRHEPGNAASLSSDRVRNLLVAGDGRIWVATRDAGIHRIEPTTRAVRRLELPAIADDELFALLEDRAGDLWVGTTGGVIRVNADTDQSRFFALPDASATSNVLALAEDSGGSIWIGTFGGGLVRLDPASGTTALFRHAPDDTRSLSSDDVRAIFEDDAGRLWVGTADGLNLLDRRSNSFSRYFADRSSRYGLSDDFVMSLGQDASGLLWVGTRSGGVSRWNPRSWSLGHRMPAWLDGAYVTAFADDANGNLWVAAIGAGLSRVSASGKRESLGELLPGGATLGDERVMSLLTDSADNLWIGTMAGGLARLSPDGELTTFRHSASDPASLSADGVMSLFEDRYERIWAGTFGGGVSRFDPADGSFRRFPQAGDGDSPLAGARATAIAEDRRGRVWVGTDGAGLVLLDPVSGKSTRFRHDPLTSATLSADTVYSLYVDDHDTVWVGLAGGGLSQVVGDPDAVGSISFRHLGRDAGINDVVYGIRADGDGGLWLSTNRGLARFDPQTGNVRNFYRSHGAQDDEFHFGAHHRTRDGRLVFGGSRGFNAFRPQEVLADETGVEVRLTQLEVLNAPLRSPGLVPQIDAIELAYDDDVLTFGFSAVDFVDPGRVQYAYRLAGFDPEFVVAKSRRVTYTNLAAGDYVFEVRAASASGVWSDVSLEVPVTVRAAPWLSGWAYALYTLLASLALVGVLRHKDKRIRRESENARALAEEVEARTAELRERNVELREASEAKSNFLARMSHEIRTPMNGVIGMTELLRATDLTDRQREFTRTISHSAEALLQIINDILDLSKIESGQFVLDESEFDLERLIEGTSGVVGSIAARKGIELLAFVEPGTTRALHGDASRLRQVLTNLTANAVKFTDAGEVTLSAREIRRADAVSLLRFEVSDTGIGIPEDKIEHIFDAFTQVDESTTQRYGGTGLGLSICRHLVHMMGGEIGVFSTENIGSTFWVEIPFRAAAATASEPALDLRGRRLLVATPIRSAMTALTRFAQHCGARVSSVGSTTEFGSLLDAGDLDADTVIVDADALDPARLLPIVKALKHAGITFICMGRDASSLEAFGASRGMRCTVLRKPLSWSQLQRALLQSADADCRASDLPADTAVLRPRVLVVEDNEVNRLVAEGMLTELGCDVCCAGDSRSGIAKATTEAFDLILMDAQLPDIDGCEATRLIREWEAGQRRRTPIVGVSANTAGEVGQRCRAAGMDDLLEKPYVLDALRDCLDACLDKPAAPTPPNGIPETLDAKALDGIRKLQSAHRPDILQRALQTFMKGSANLAEALAEARGSHCAASMRAAAHALKSSSANIGATRLAELAERLEAACRAEDLDAAVQLAIETEAAIAPVHRAIEAELQRRAA